MHISDVKVLAITEWIHSRIQQNRPEFYLTSLYNIHFPQETKSHPGEPTADSISRYCRAYNELFGKSAWKVVNKSKTKRLITMTEDQCNAILRIYRAQVAGQQRVSFTRREYVNHDTNQRTGQY